MTQPLLLILGGMSLVGTGKAVDSLGKVALPAAIVVLKVLVLPNIISVLAIEFSVDSSSEQFSFEFGLVPAAASTMVMVGQFGANSPGTRHQELMLMLSGAYAIGRALSICLLFVFAALLTIPSGAPMRALITQTCVVMHVLSLCGTLWIVLLALVLPRYRTHAPHVRVMGLTLLQLAFSASFLAVGQDRILHDGTSDERLTLFTVVNSFRWAVDGWLLVVTWAQAREAGLGPGARRVGRCRPEAETAFLSARMWLWYAGLSAVLSGIALSSLPWLLGGIPYPKDPPVPLWILYDSQMLTYAIVYCIVAAVVFGLLALTIVRARIYEKLYRYEAAWEELGGSANAPPSPLVWSEHVAARACANEQRTPQQAGGCLDATSDSAAPSTASSTVQEEPSELGAELGASSRAAAVAAAAAAAAAHSGLQLRIGILCACGLIRFVAQGVLCLKLWEDDRIAGTPQGFMDIEGYIAQLLIVVMVFEDGQGFWTFLMFGIPPELVALIQSALSRSYATLKRLFHQGIRRTETGRDLDNQTQSDEDMWAPRTADETSFVPRSDSPTMRRPPP